MGSTELTTYQTTGVARTHKTSVRLYCWVNGHLSDDEKAKVQYLDSFVSGREYEYYTLLIFTGRCDILLRAIVHPTEFIFQDSWNRFDTFKINFNPTEEQVRRLRVFLDKLKDLFKEHAVLPPPIKTFDALTYQENKDERL